MNLRILKKKDGSEVLQKRLFVYIYPNNENFESDEHLDMPNCTRIEYKWQNIPIVKEEE